MSDKLTLLGCPFCGAPGEAVVVPPPYSSATIRCRDCRAETGMCDDEQRAAIAWNSRAALAAEEESGWRTMDSAPKDGTYFLALIPYERKHHQMVGCFAPSGNFVSWPARRVYEPSHWMPLPPSPKDKTP